MKLKLSVLMISLMMFASPIMTPAAPSNLETSSQHQIPDRHQLSTYFKLGNEVLLEDYRHLIDGKRVGLITNQTGVNSEETSLIDILAKDDRVNLTALYAPEHGIDGKALAGEYVKSYVHEELDIPVYSLYGSTRKPTEDMLDTVDILLYDIQDIGARTYTYISTLNYAMSAAKEFNTPIVVLDRPNPLGGLTVEGPVLEDPFKTFVGVDNLPKAHGMTAGELGKFFNRNIGADLTVVPMRNYQRNMLFQDTSLPFVQTSPNIPDLVSCFGYMATGLGEGTGVFQADRFKWIGGKGLDSVEFAKKLTDSDLQGINFIPEQRGEAGGVRLEITDYYSFNPAKTGLFALGYAFQSGDFTVPKSGNINNPAEIVMFDKIMGTNKVGEWLEEGLSPKEMVNEYTPDLNKFKQERQKYLIEDYEPEFLVKVQDSPLHFDTEPYIDSSARMLVPLRAISESLGALVDWDQGTQSVTIRRGNDDLLFTIGSATVKVNNDEKTMDTAPIIRNGRTMVPVRYFSEYLGAVVDYNAAWKKVEIFDNFPGND